MERIVIEAKSAFGVLDAQTKKWKNTNDKTLLDSIVRGKAYDVEIADVKSSDGKVRKQIVKAVEVNFEGGAPNEAPKSEVKVSVAPKPAPAPFKKREFTKAVDAKPVDWDKKDRSQLVGGRSHDAVELVAASLQSCTPMPKVLELYKEALEGILKLAEEIK
jgi:hypothetical protein